MLSCRNHSSDFWESPNSVPHRAVPAGRCVVRMKVAGKCLSHMVMLAVPEKDRKNENPAIPK